MKRMLPIILAIIGLAWSQGNAGEIERIINKGEIVVSLNKGYRPFCITENNKIQGLDVDLAKLIADYLGVQVKFIMPPRYKDQIPKLLAGESDINPGGPFVPPDHDPNCGKGLESRIYRSLFLSQPGSAGRPRHGGRANQFLFWIG